MASRPYITYSRDPKTISKKHMRPLLKKALAEVVEEWHEESLPEHFTERGRRRWRYRARRKSYARTKRSQYGHNKPLVKTGTLRRQAKRMARITGSSKAARGNMTVPWYATKRFGGRAPYADEMTATTLGESQVMAKKLKAKIEQKLRTAVRAGGS